MLAPISRSAHSLFSHAHFLQLFVCKETRIYNVRRLICDVDISCSLSVSSKYRHFSLSTV